MTGTITTGTVTDTIIITALTTIPTIHGTIIITLIAAAITIRITVLTTAIRMLPWEDLISNPIISAWAATPITCTATRTRVHTANRFILTRIPAIIIIQTGWVKRSEPSLKETIITTVLQEAVLRAAEPIQHRQAAAVHPAAVHHPAARVEAAVEV